MGARQFNSSRPYSSTIRREYSDVIRHYLTLFKIFPEDLAGYFAVLKPI